jgi:hypothetical protein
LSICWWREESIECGRSICWWKGGME